MTLTPGQRLGPYQVTAKLGEGGMGEVYRASDTKLKRQVAIKVLPPAFTEDRERLARFEREAQLLAQLHHPNIASIFGLEESGGMRALVMELVEGDDLSALIAKGPLPLAEALAIARQIAEALEAAHEQGIVHRDLKPGNIKVRGDGTVKVLDFGLAKAMDSAGMAAPAPASLRSPTLMNSPTLTGAHGTQIGVILGTAAYMAPEQARGKAVDRRADIWAFGVVLYEMLTGRRLFAGEEASDVLAAVIRQDVDLGALPSDVPQRTRRLLARCLDRDPKTRLRDIGEARLLLSGAEDAEPDRLAPIAAPQAGRGAWLWVALPLVAALAAAIAWRAKPAAPAPTVRLSIALPAGEQVTSAPAISPDGQTIAYAAGRSAATSRLYLRGLNDFVSRPVDSGAGASWPFFSPDSRSIAFFAGGKLRRAPVAGGAARNLAAAPRPFGGTWAANGTILYVPLLNSGIWRVGPEGGQPEQLSQPDDGDNGYAHVFPQALPGGDVLFTFWGKSFKTARLTPGADGWRPVTFDAASGRISTFADAGYLLRGDASGGLLAAPWRPAITEPVEPETVVLENVFWVAGTDRSWVSTAANGTVVYVPGNPARRRLVWVDRQGVVEELPGEPDLLNSAALSRDGRRVAHNGRAAVWVQDVGSGARVRLLTDITWAFLGGWLPGDQSVVVSNNRTGNWDVFAVPPGGGDLRPLVQRPRTQHPLAVAPDGAIVFSDYGLATETGLDLWVRSPGGEISELVASPFQDSQASVSADGRYVAYVSDETGRSDVYAIPFTGGLERVMVSVDGGTGPMWSRDGRELFYRAGDDLISVEVLSTEPLALGSRRRLLDVSAFEPQYFREFDVAPDGKRFLFIRAEPQSRPMRLDVILNWFPELAAKVPAR